MFLIMGVTPRDRVITEVTFVCEYCGVAALQHVVESASRFSVFFIPLFAVSKSYFVACSNCGGMTSLTKEQATHGMEWAARNRQLQ
ncbi:MULTISPECIES: zinc-ribbon domain-containing protein [unclassified Agromyces]|uniref:zinc-ribbon domain-containing protein n=1 Tax=unclassified Agromyces TaxID=2639701 RepID=UPI0030147DEF